MSRLASDEVDAEIAERLLHPAHSSREPDSRADELLLVLARRIVRNPGPAAGVLAESGDDRGDIVGDTAEVTAVDAHGQVDGRLYVDMRDLRRHVDAAHRSHVAERDRPLLVGAVDRHVEDGVDRARIFSFRVLDADEVLDCCCSLIDPEVPLVELDAGIEGRNQVLHDVQLREAEDRRLHLVDVDDVLGIVEPLQIRQPTTPSIFVGSSPFTARSATSCALSSSFAVIWMLIGVDFPSFMGDCGSCRRRRRRTRSPSNRLSAAKLFRSFTTYSWAEWLRSQSWTFTTESIGPRSACRRPTSPRRRRSR